MARIILNALTANSVTYKARVTGVGEAGEAQLAPERVEYDGWTQLEAAFRVRIVDGEMVSVDE